MAMISKKRREKLMLGDEHTTSDRKWEEMDRELLIYIMKRYRWYEWCRFDFIICKSWLSAFRDVLFPPGEVLDLRLLDEHEDFRYGYRYEVTIRRFCHYLKLNLNRRSPNHYTKLILSECLLYYDTYEKIAEMLPSLKSVVFPAKMISYREDFTTRRPPKSFFCCDNEAFNQTYTSIPLAMLKDWKNLEEAHFNIRMTSYLPYHIRNLTIVGKVNNTDMWLPDGIASAIAKGVPLLDRLSITSYRLTLTGMAMILDGHKNLSYLDLEHGSCVPKEEMKWWQFPSPMDYSWPEDIAEQIARVQTLVTWDGKICPNCTDLYSILLCNFRLLDDFKSSVSRKIGLFNALARDPWD